MTEMVQHIPAIIRVVIAFFVILAAIRGRLSLGNAFLLGALCLGVLFGLDARSMAGTLLRSVIYPKTLFLAIVVSLILVLSSSMELAGQMNRLLSRFRGLISKPRITLVIFPALIGLLPMPGGAVFSAPMVKELGGRTGLGPDHLSYINYWFRHIWEYWWPLYPGVLLATSLSGIDLWTFAVSMIPLTLAAFAFGYLPLRNLHLPAGEGQAGRRPSLVPFLRELSPIALVIAGGLGLGMVFSHFFPESNVAKESGLIIALCIAIVWVWYDNRLGPVKIRRVLTDPHILSMLYMVLAIFAFKGILEGSQAITLINDEIARLHVPLTAVVVLLPFFVGAVVGITVAFVGSTFPIIISLVVSFDGTSSLMPYIMLAMGCGFLGVMLTPLHLCFMLSNQYFKTGITAVYRHMVLPCLCFFLVCLSYFFILRRLFDSL
ncbi:MAG: DUF401 family protein [Deltaproteobacteria bacterium]|nr:DUF401 family protein [Deltaproteobacteria bacterium]